MARSPLEVVHVGSACRDLTSDDPARLAARWRRDVRGADDGAARPADRRAHRRRRARRTGRRARPAARRGCRPAARRRSPRPRSSRTARRRPVASRPVTRSASRSTCPTFPETWLAARAWSLVPVAGEIDEAWAAAIPGAALRHGRLAGDPARPGARGASVGRRLPTPSALLRRADLVGVSHHDVGPGHRSPTLAAFLHPGADLLVTEGRDGRPARPRRTGRTGRDPALPADRHRPRDRPDRCRRHVPGGPAGLGPAPGDRRPAALAALARPALRGRGGVARGRGTRPGGRPGSGGRPRPASARAGPPRGRPERGGAGRSGRSRGPLTAVAGRRRRRPTQAAVQPCTPVVETPDPRRSRLTRRTRSASSAGSGRPSRRRRSIASEPARAAVASAAVDRAADARGAWPARSRR